MNSLLAKVVVFFIAVAVSSGQIWDIFAWGDEDESSDDFSFDYDDGNDTSLEIHKFSSSDIKNEQEILEKSSQIVIDEISLHVKAMTGSDLEIKFIQDQVENQIDENFEDDENDDDEEEILDPLSMLISDNTVEVYNALHMIKNFETETRGKRLRIFDIFLWSNVSNEKIKDVLEEYYMDTQQVQA